MIRIATAPVVEPRGMGNPMAEVSFSNGSLKHSGTLVRDGTVWDALTGDSGCAVLLVDSGGRIAYCNGAAGRLFELNATELAGRTLAELFEPAMAKERVSFVSRAIEGGAPFCVEGLVRGRLTRCAHRALRAEDGSGVLLVFAAAGTRADGPGSETIRARHQDPGALASLTARELEILKLIGEGLSTAEIAAALHRSVKTVEWHRVSLGSKLGQTNRVGLARIAFAAGLTGGLPSAT